MYDKTDIGSKFALSGGCPFTYSRALAKEGNPMSTEDGKSFYIGYAGQRLMKTDSIIERKNVLNDIIGQILEEEKVNGHIYADAVVEWAKKQKIIFPEPGLE
jgi:hypothetical protein